MRGADSADSAFQPLVVAIASVGPKVKGDALVPAGEEGGGGEEEEDGGALRCSRLTAGCAAAALFGLRWRTAVETQLGSIDPGIAAILGLFCFPQGWTLAGRPRAQVAASFTSKNELKQIQPRPARG